MKRLVTLMLAAGLVLGGASVSTSSAVELKAGGQWQFAFGWGDTGVTKHDQNDRFQAVQRIRPEFRFIADENLQAVLQLEIGKGQFGNGGWALGNDGKTVKVRYGYVDWVVPGLDTKVRMGMQNMKLPDFVGNAMVFSGANDGAGIALYQPVNDWFDFNVFWMRAENDSTSAPHDIVDVFALALNFKGDGWKVSPWAMVAPIGQKASYEPGGSNESYLRTGLMSAAMERYDTGKTDDNGNPIYGTKYYNDHSKSGAAWWVGFGGELTFFDPFRVALDFAYGSVDLGKDAWNNDAKRRGWAVNLLAQYKLDFVTPGIQFWYASGDDANIADGSERLPYIFQDNGNIAKGFGDSGFGYEQSMYAQAGIDGNWGLQLRFDNINYGVKGLSHDLRAAFVKGTNNTQAAKSYMLQAGGDYGTFGDFNTDNGRYLTTSDKVWQVMLDTNYQIYKNLTAALTLTYMKYDLAEKVWGDRAGYDDRSWAAVVTMQYKF